MNYTAIIQGGSSVTNAWRKTVCFVDSKETHVRAEAQAMADVHGGHVVRITPDPVQPTPDKSLLERIAELERERDAAMSAHAAILHFCEVEMGWMFFRAEYRIGDNPTISETNACRLREFLATLKTVPTGRNERNPDDQQP